MALLKDLTVFGATNLISDTFANNIWANGYHHNAHDNDDSVLLAGGGYKAINTLLGSGYWANQAIQTASSTATTPQFGKVMINTTSTTYNLNVGGDSHVTGWSRAASGFFCQGYGVHFTHSGNFGEIDVQSGNEFLWGSNSTSLYFNYRAVSRGTTVTDYIWNAGSSTTYANHKIGRLHIFPTNGTNSYSEGIRVHAASNSWSDIMLCSVANTGDTGTDANTWGIFNNNGTFAIAKNTSSYNANCAIGNSGGTWYINNRLTINSSGQVTPVANYFNAGMYGNYASTRLGHIWSIGTSYYMSSDGKNPNSTYGMLYFHTDWSNNATYNTENASKTALGTYAGGHQIGFFNNGVLGVSIGLGGNIWNKGYFYGNGFKHSDHNNDNAVLLAGGGWSLISDLKDAETVTITKSLTITEAWMDTGIVMDVATFPHGNGTYAVQIIANTVNNGNDGYDRYYSGVMSIYTGVTNGTSTDEIVLHNASHAWIRRIYLRTLQQSGSTSYTKIQIATEKDLTTSYNITFKFRKLV